MFGNLPNWTRPGGAKIGKISKHHSAKLAKFPNITHMITYTN
jgi:hypothetical protein